MPINEDNHRPTKNGWFMATTNLSKPSDWKNKDTITLSTFTNENLQNNISIISLSPSEKINTNEGEITFSSLIHFETGEYGENQDSSYYTVFVLKNDTLCIKETFNGINGRGRAYKFKIVWTGRNCCQWIRINPTKRKLYPKKIKSLDKRGTVRNYKHSARPYEFRPFGSNRLYIRGSKHKMELTSIPLHFTQHKLLALHSCFKKVQKKKDYHF